MSESLIAKPEYADLIRSPSPNNNDDDNNSSSNVDEKKDAILKLFQYDLERHRMREVLEMFKGAVVPEIQKNGSYIVWDLVPIICQRLRGLSEFRFKTFNLCRQILIDLCEICNPKELLIIFLSELENDLSTTRNSSENNHLMVITDDNNTGHVIDENDDIRYCEITDSNCFKALLKPFEVILLKLPKKRNETLKSVLYSLNEHISRLSLSKIPLEKEDYDDNENNKKSRTTPTTISPAVKSLYSVLSMYVDFLEVFVKEVDLNNSRRIENQTTTTTTTTNTKTSDPNIQRVILLKTLLSMLDYPLKYLDLSDNNNNGDDAAMNGSGRESGDIKSKNEIHQKTSSTTINANANANLFNEDVCSARSIAIKIVRLISCLHSNFYTLVNRTDLVTSDEEFDNSEFDYSGTFLVKEKFQSAMAVLSYILAIEPEQSPANFTPLVYTHVYSFGQHLPYLQSLLEDQQFVVYQKGFELLEKFLDRIKPETLEESFLDLIRQHPIDKALIAKMVYKSNKTARIISLTLFKRLVHAFEPRGRYKILCYLLTQPRMHCGFQGVMVSLYKDLLFTHPVYQGANLHRVVRSMIAISLPEESDSDLLERNDLVFGVLNFLRYVLKRDPKSQNTTKIWDILSVIQEHFLKPLLEALELLRTHIKLELMKLKEKKMKLSQRISEAGSGSNASGSSASGSIGSKPSKITVSTGKGNKKRQRQIDIIMVPKLEDQDPNSPLPRMMIEQEHKQMMLALQNFELLESIIVRLKEIIEEP